MGTRDKMSALGFLIAFAFFHIAVCAERNTKGEIQTRIYLLSYMHIYNDEERQMTKPIVFFS